MKVVMVCAIARSGSSLACGVLSQLDVHFHQTRPTNDFNPRGNFETHEIIPIMQKAQGILKPIIQAGKVPTDSMVTELANEARPAMDALIARIAKGKSLWGFKCPTKYTIDVFLKMFPDIHLVVSSRSPIDQALSYQILKQIRAPNCPFPQALLEVNESNYFMFKTLVRLKVPMTFTTFERLRSQPLVEAEILAREIGLDFSDENKKKVLSFVDPDMKTNGYIK
jgi:hypothetical protein